MRFLFRMREGVTDFADEPEVLLDCWRLLEFDHPRVAASAASWDARAADPNARASPPRS